MHKSWRLALATVLAAMLLTTLMVHADDKALWRRSGFCSPISPLPAPTNTPAPPVPVIPIFEVGQR